MYKLELFVQRNKVEKKYIKLQALVDNELEDIIFSWYPDTENVLFPDEIFHKQKKQREKDVVGEQSQQVILEVEAHKALHHFFR
jgi:hypothetical protein